MDPFSLTTGCIGLVAAIAQLSSSIASFIADVRSSRADLDGVSRELLSLKTILELLESDLSHTSSTNLPETLTKQVNGILRNCTSVVQSILNILKKHEEGNRVYKAAQWAISGKSDVDKLRTSLEAHKSALEIALDMIQM
jgi:cell shape-determining protein MreC